MAMAPVIKLVLGSLAFAIFWVLAVFPSVPFLPIVRTAGSLFGAMLMLMVLSSVAGNLTLLGSAANLIVCEQARRAVSHGYTLTFTKHFKFGLPSTLIVTASGLLLIN